MCVFFHGLLGLWDLPLLGGGLSLLGGQLSCVCVIVVCLLSWFVGVVWFALARRWGCLCVIVVCFLSWFVGVV